LVDFTDLTFWGGGGKKGVNPGEKVNKKDCKESR